MNYVGLERIRSCTTSPSASLDSLSNLSRAQLKRQRVKLKFCETLLLYFHNLSKKQSKAFGTNMDDFASPIGSWFEGCIALLRYSSASKPFENVKLLKSHDVDGNCSDKVCSSEPNLCQHGGRCVDLVTRTECDCEGTGYYGQYCEQSGKNSIFVFTPSRSHQ